VSRKFKEFMREVEAEARREGPQAVAELKAFDAHSRLAAELLALRKARGLTQRQLAQKTGVNQSEISRIEGGGANPTVSTVAALAGALGAEFSLQQRKHPVGSSRQVATAGAGRGRMSVGRAARRASHRASDRNR
jgi:transcriptional regulator with XRE-family HTH domain